VKKKQRNVKRVGDCLIWDGPKNTEGYGYIYFAGFHWRATRLLWTIMKGDIPEKMFVCHSCDTPSCVNIEHLFIGTPAENSRDRDAKGRAGLGDQRGALNNAAKLDKARVKEIRRLSNQGWTQARLGKKFGVSQAAIFYALRIGWKE
jgi:hypothetical protein